MIARSTNSSVETPPFAPGVFSLEPDGAPVLLGGYCRACSRRFFPRPGLCPGCLEPSEEVSLGSLGTLYSHTVVRVRPPLGLPQPYAVGYVDLEGSGLRVFCLLDPGAVDQFRIGLPVRLAVGPLGHDGRGSPRLRPYFTPLTDGQGGEG